MLDVELSQMKAQGLIRDSISPFNSPVICIKKKDGSLRVVIDFRKLNSEIVVDTFALPRIDEILYSVGNAKVFSTLDLKAAFHHIELDEKSCLMIAFSVVNHKFE